MRGPNGEGTMETRTLVKAAAAVEGVTERKVTGYAAIFDVLDDENDIIRPGAFKDTLREDRRAIKARWKHRDPLGRPTKMEEDSTGLLVTIKVAETELGDEVLQLAKEGVADRMSFWGEALTYRPETAPNGRTGRVIEKIRLREVSITDIAVQGEARVTAVKGLQGPPSELTEAEALEWLERRAKALSARLERFTNG